VVADANGRFPDVYLQAARYKILLTTSGDVTIDTLDPVDGTSQLITASSAPAVSYAFLRYHNSTDGNVYRRNAANSAWINEGPVDSIGNAATVSEVLTGTSTSVVVTPDALAGLWQRGADIASASTLSLPAGGGGVFNITGTTGVTAISSAQGGRCIKLRFAGALTITHNAASMILPGAANITTAAGDTAEFINEAAADGSGSNWRCFSYQRATGSPLNLTTYTAAKADLQTGTSTALFSTVGNMQHHRGMAKVWLVVSLTGTDSGSWNITSTSDLGVGRFGATIATDFSSAIWSCSVTPEGTSSRMGAARAVAAGTFEVHNYLGDGTSNEAGATQTHAAGFGDQ
jgi:hypothetical protein